MPSVDEEGAPWSPSPACMARAASGCRTEAAALPPRTPQALQPRRATAHPPGEPRLVSRTMCWQEYGGAGDSHSAEWAQNGAAAPENAGQVLKRPNTQPSPKPVAPPSGTFLKGRTPHVYTSPARRTHGSSTPRPQGASTTLSLPRHGQTAKAHTKSVSRHGGLRRRKSSRTALTEGRSALPGGEGRGARDTRGHSQGMLSTLAVGVAARILAFAKTHSAHSTD